MKTREIVATFGLKQPSVGLAWETDCAAWLRDTHSTEALTQMFADLREGESPLDLALRRAVLRAVCRHVGSDIQIGPGVVLKHPETMEFGDTVFIGAQAMIQGRFDGTCRIGNHVWIGPQAYFDARDLVIEDYVGWGPGAKVLGSSHTGEPMDVPIIATNLVIKPVVIGYGADIGVNSVILPGVHVGANSIVGAGAVVTHDVPEYAVVAGVPARVIRSRGDK
jgi:acetyltransferase-like isoleucine patch superfamily enzyme